jgi:hypothetical protein
MKRWLFLKVVSDRATKILDSNELIQKEGKHISFITLLS